MLALSGDSAISEQLDFLFCLDPVIPLLKMHARRELHYSATLHLYHTVVRPTLYDLT